jgi:hypothetical protein
VSTLLTTLRADLFDSLSTIGTANTYRRRRTNYEFPALIVGWPQTMDFRPEMGGARDFVIDVIIGIEVSDEDSSDDQLSDLIEEAVAVLQDVAQWDVQPATDFGEELTGDNRVIIWCRLPVAVFE